MNEYSVRGKNYYPDSIIRLYVSREETLEPVTPERFRIAFITGGSGSLRVNGRRLGVSGPSILILNEADIVAVDQDDRLRFTTVYFHPEIINSLFSFETIRSASPGFSYTAGQDFYMIAPYLAQAVDSRYFPLDEWSKNNVKNMIATIAEELEAQDSDSWPCSVRCDMIALLFFVSNLRKAGTDGGAKPKKAALGDIDEIVTYIDTNFNRKLSVNDVARLFFTNRTTLNDRFKERTGKTLVSYVTDIRVKTAASMLHNTDLSIREIMYRVGYEDKAHFGRLFKRETGMAPSDYRKRYRLFL